MSRESGLSTDGNGGDAITEKSKMADSGHICQLTGTKIDAAQLDHQGNIPDKFRKIPTCSLGGDATTRS